MPDAEADGGGRRRLGEADEDPAGQPAGQLPEVGLGGAGHVDQQLQRLLRFGRAGQRRFPEQARLRRHGPEQRPPAELLPAEGVPALLGQHPAYLGAGDDPAPGQEG